MNFRNRKVVIFGLGSYKNGSGISAALFFAKAGAKLLITDLKNKAALHSQLRRLKNFRDIKYVLGRHREKDFNNADFIFKNPSVPKNSPYLKIACRHKIPVINDWTIFFEEKPNNLLIGITGTKGKSTTTALIFEVLKTAGKKTVLCGNIGQSPLALLDKIKKNTIVVAELSSWLLQEFKNIKMNSSTTLGTSPQIAVITNLMPEHLDKYRNIGEYFRDKENIFIFQKTNDYLILNKNDENLRKLAKKAKSKIVWFDGQPKNAAVAVAKILKIPQETVNKTIKKFKDLPGRLEFIREKNGVKYYNDTTATMPDATIYALQQLKKTCPECIQRIILIAGGVDKKLDYKNLAKKIPEYCKALVLFEGTASQKIKTQIPKLKNAIKKLQIIAGINSMEKAVSIVRRLSKKGDFILLSPAAASFNLFKNEFDRGKQFNKFVKALK